jgi:hypothetical protein
MSTMDLDKARAELERAEQRAIAAREKAEKAAALEAERKAERERQWDMAMAKLYSPDALDADVAAAERRFEKALADDPVVQAAVELRQARMRRYLAADLFRGCQGRLTGEPAPAVGTGPTEVEVGLTIERLVERRGSALAHDELEQWWQVREAAASE